MSSQMLHDLVRRGDSELAVVTLNPAGDPDLATAALWDDPLCFVAASDHPLSRANTGARPLDLTELAGYPVILPDLATYTGRIVAGLFEAQQIPLSATLSTNYLETITMLVSIGLGWSVLPSSLTEDLTILETTAPPIGRVLGWVTNPQRTLSSAANAFIEVLKARVDPGLA